MTGKEYLEIKKYQAGIYWFKNIVTNEYYVGQSIDIRKRFCKHLNNMKRRINYPIYNALNKYGLQNFEFHIEVIINGNYTKLELTNILNELEIEYIKKYDSFNKGYNLTTGGFSISGYKVSDELKEKYSKISKAIQNDGRNKVFVYNIKTKEYSEWSTLKEFFKKYNLKSRHIISKKLTVVDNQWIASRTIEDLERKISELDNHHSTSEFKCDMSSQEFISDLKLLTRQEIVEKYKISKKSYYNYLKRLNIPNKTEQGKDPRAKCTKKDFISDYKKLTRDELCVKYNISIRRYYTLYHKYILNY